LIALETLNLTNCSRLQKLLPSFGRLARLKHLEMDGCNMLNYLPWSFRELSSLQQLALTCCSSVEELPPTFSRLTALECLTLSLCTKLQRLPERFGDLDSLQHLALDNCRALTEVPASFKRLQLSTLLLHGSGLPQAEQQKLREVSYSKAGWLVCHRQL
jgi:Leucine-rich repeat (LRR) protein